MSEIDRPQEIPDTLPLIPLRDLILFPNLVVPLFVGRERSINALEEAMRQDHLVALVTQHEAETQEPGPDDIYEIGCVASVMQELKLPDGTAKALVESVGGVVTHELGIIRAAGADLSATQLTALEDLQSVDRIYPNNTARISAKPGSDPAPAPVVETVRDDFNIINYNNNDGTQPWLGPWQESQDEGTAGDGTVRIVGMELQLHNRDGGSLESIERTVDLSLATTATLSVSYSGFGEGGMDIVATFPPG